MHPTPSLPLLVLLSAFYCTGTSASPAPAPPPQASTSSSTLVDASPPPPTYSLPLYQHSNSISRRSNSDAVRNWALREKGRINNKYGESGGDDASQAGASETALGKRKERRQQRTTALSVAGYAPSATSTSGRSSASTSGTGTRSARNSTATTAVGEVKVLNFEADLAYFAPVGVGVPPQYMNVILDTGSADLWIASSECTVATGCDGIPTINQTLSTSSLDMNTSFSVRYGSGSASGDIIQDYVGFAGYNVSSQAYALCDTVSNDLLSGNISGLMGLGWQQLAASGVTPFWQNLYGAGVLPFPGFAFSLTRFVNVTGAADVEPGGLLTFGYLNNSLYDGLINYIDIPDGLESYWLIPMEALSVNATNTTFPEGQGEPLVAIDTGTTLIGGPQEVVSQVYGLIDGAAAATGPFTGYYSYPCDAEVNVSMTFGGVTYNMTSDDFNLGPFGVTNNISTCLGAFFDLSLSSTSRISWVIGAAFLKNVFSVYRASPPSVGFALLSNGSTIYNSSLSLGTPGYTTNTSSSAANVTQIPTGIFGPSGATSLRTTIGANTITTAVEAGMTVGVVPRPSGGVGREEVKRGLLVGLVGFGLVLLW